MSETYLGIDLGTTFSAVAYLDNHGAPVTIPNAEGDLTTPSVVLFDRGGDIIVGREARRAALVEPERVAQNVKRHMGDPFYPQLIDDKRLTPTAISSLILRKMRQDAERRIGRVGGAVITVPAYFDEARRQATADAGRLAGLNVLDIINEPTSAALAYAYQGLSEDVRLRSAPQVAQAMASPQEKIVVVYDLGGGTFDVTILRIKGHELVVLATAGDVQLGGRDWDERLFNHMADAFAHTHRKDPRDNPVSRQTLLLEAEETKKILSARTNARFTVNHAGKSFSGEISRDQFERMTEDLLFRSENRLTRVLTQAKLKWHDVAEVLAVGGSTRMPQVRKMLARVTGREPNVTLSPDEAVAHGAAIHAAVILANARLSGDAPEPPTASPGLLDHIAPLKTAGAPGSRSRFKGPVGDLLRSIKTVNVNAHSLGLVTHGPDRQLGVSVLIPRNTQLPVSVRKRFGTATENQTAVTVRVVEGETRDPAECILVGSCSIRSLPPGLPKGSPVEVTFSYDNSGRLHVKAVDVRSGNWATVDIERRSGVAREQVELDAEEKVIGAKVS